MQKTTCKKFLAALCNENRFSIVKSLRKKDKNVAQLAKELSMNQTTLSHNLRILRKYGIVTVEKRKKFRHYELNSEFVVPIIDLVNKHLTKYCKND